MNELFEAFKQECRQMRIRLYDEQCRLGEFYRRHQMSGQPELLLGTERRALLAMLTEAQQRLDNAKSCLDEAVEAYARGKANLFAERQPPAPPVDNKGCEQFSTKPPADGIATGMTIDEVAEGLLKDYEKRHPAKAEEKPKRCDCEWCCGSRTMEQRNPTRPSKTVPVLYVRAGQKLQDLLREKVRAQEKRECNCASCQAGRAS